MNEVVYKLIATVDDEVVFSSEYPDSTMLQEELYKAEGQVERKLEELEEDEAE